MEKEPAYISVNRKAYDSLAEDYRLRANADRVKDVKVIAPFVNYLIAKFGRNIKVLDIGFGNGVNLAMFRELGFNVSGVDISKKLLAVASELCPGAELRLGDFMDTDYQEKSFNGIFSKASIHLYPKDVAIRAIQKAADLLVPGGMFYITTTASDHSSEGYVKKTGYSMDVVRYRKNWTENELIHAVLSAGLEIYKSGYNDEIDWDKRWFNIWAIKK